MDKRKTEEHRNKLIQNAVYTLRDQLVKYFPGQTLGVECTRPKKRGESFEYAIVRNPLLDERTLLAVQVIIAHKQPVLLAVVLDETLVHDESGDCVIDVLIELEQQLPLISFLWRPILNTKL